MHEIIKEDIERIISEDLPWNMLEGQSILVTGASGVLGTYIVYTLMRLNEGGKNIRVNALCRNRACAEVKFGEYLNNKNFNLLIQDVCDPIDDDYRSDFIIHAASPANPYICENDPYEVIRTNVFACDNLIKKSKIWNSKQFLLLSSSAVYGYKSPMEGISETYRGELNFTDCKSAYALSKQMCEMMIASKQNESDCIYKSVRPFVIYGPGEKVSHKKCLTDFTGNCVKNERIVLKSPGKAIRSYIYIADAICALFYVVMKGEGGAYNISSEENVYSINEVADFFCHEGKVEKFYDIDMETEYLQNTTSIMVGKNEKIKLLGWKEHISFQEGIHRMVEWANNGEFFDC